MILAAMAAMPLIQKLEQGLTTRIANGVSAFFAPTDSKAPGQNVPSQSPSSSANSTAPTPASTLSNSVTSALLQLQDSAGPGLAHHHHGVGRYKTASDLFSQMTDSAGPGSSTSTAASATTAVTA